MVSCSRFGARRPARSFSTDADQAVPHCEASAATLPLWHSSRTRSSRSCVASTASSRVRSCVAAGVPPGTIDAWLVRGRLVAVQREVYAVSGHAGSRRAVRARGGPPSRVRVPDCPGRRCSPCSVSRGPPARRAVWCWCRTVAVSGFPAPWCGRTCWPGGTAPPSSASRRSPCRSRSATPPLDAPDKAPPGARRQRTRWQGPPARRTRLLHHAEVAAPGEPRAGTPVPGGVLTLYAEQALFATRRARGERAAPGLPGPRRGRLRSAPSPTSPRPTGSTSTTAGSATGARVRQRASTTPTEHGHPCRPDAASSPIRAARHRGDPRDQGDDPRRVRSSTRRRTSATIVARRLGLSGARPQRVERRSRTPEAKEARR